MSDLNNWMKFHTRKDTSAKPFALEVGIFERVDRWGLHLNEHPVDLYESLKALHDLVVFYQWNFMLFPCRMLSTCESF